MPPERICKTVRQHSSGPVPEETMRKLREIADDYGKVKNCVYARFGGIRSLSKLYPGYTVQNEMTASGLREQMNMPSVYFYLAVFDALGDIKDQWVQTGKRVAAAVGRNRNLTPGEAHYLRFVLSVNNAMEAVLNDKPVRLPGELQRHYERLAGEVDVHKLANYLKRQVRKQLRRLRTDKAEGFSISERAYRYADHGIYISTKEKRKRVFVPLTDGNTYDRQLYVKLDGDSLKLEILAPVDVRVRRHGDYTNQVGLSMGMITMLTADGGNEYGDRLGDYLAGQAEWIREQNRIYRENRENNPGRQKYMRQKRKRDAALETYLNAELNRFFREEKPDTVYLPKLPAHSMAGVNRQYNRLAGLWRKGYILERLRQKCREQAIEIVEVAGKDISNECSECGGMGKREGGMFSCPVCGLLIKNKVNAARNAKKRGLGAQAAAVSRAAE